MEDGDADKTQKTIFWERTSGSHPGRIAGATQRQYKLTANDIGEEIRFAITATNSDGVTGGNSSAETVGPILGIPVAADLKISGKPVVGELLTASFSLQDGDDAKTRKTIKWTSKRGVVASDTRYYTPLSTDVGGNISFEVTPISAENLIGALRKSNPIGPVKGIEILRPKVSNLGATIQKCGYGSRGYTANYDYDAQGGSEEQGTVIMWTGSAPTAYGRNVCVNILKYNGFNTLTITPKNKEGIVGDVVKKKL
ncbi:S-layer domain-containing protein [Serratia sp. M24T3]|nr:S-layer domain-containing protein [Serratia sp. M24T3]